jgi:hypothetical protein
MRMTQTAPNAKLTSTITRQLESTDINTPEHILSRFIKIKVPIKPALTWKPLRSAEKRAGKRTARILEVQLIQFCHR